MYHGGGGDSQNPTWWLVVCCERSMLGMEAVVVPVLVPRDRNTLEERRVLRYRYTMPTSKLESWMSLDH